MTQTNCGDFEALIALEVAGDLPAAEAAPVERHLNECEPCRRFAAEMAADLQWLQAAHQEPLDSAALHQVRVGVMRRLESEQNRWDRPFGGLTMLGWRWQWVATAAAAAIFSGFAWWGATLNRSAVVALSPRIESGIESRASERGERNSQAAEDPAGDIESHAKQTSEAALARGGAPSEDQSAPGKSASPEDSTTPLVAAGQSGKPDSENHPASRGPSPRESAFVPRLARVDPAPEAASNPPRPPTETLETGTQAEIVTALLNEPLDEEPTEVVMLKIPTSNPSIVVYWVMDEEKQPQTGVENQGD
jgi:hypothetical protein